MMVPSWLQWARQEAGVREIPGVEHNARVVEYWQIGKVQLDVRDDEVPWCAAFVAAALESAGYRGTRSGRARSYSEAPSLFDQCDSRLGAIVVLSSNRGAASGHVGFLTGVGHGRVMVWGGNQGNRVCEAPFPSAGLVGLYWPKAAPSYRNYPMAPTVSAGGATVSDR